jgi:hypothetical protein
MTHGLVSQVQDSKNPSEHTVLQCSVTNPFQGTAQLTSPEVGVVVPGVHHRWAQETGPRPLGAAQRKGAR